MKLIGTTDSFFAFVELRREYAVRRRGILSEAEASLSRLWQLLPTSQLFPRMLPNTSGWRGNCQASGSNSVANSRDIAIHWGGYSLVDSYDARLLREQDLLRADFNRSPKSETEWKVSRALLQIMGAGERATSISHKLGHAVVASAPPGWQLGIDLEQVRARDVLRLSAWMASDAEAAALAALPPEQALRHFYRLWTFKEAMIKARGQDFPADLKTNTLTIDAASGQWCMQTPGARTWSLRQFEAEPGWLVSVVWRAPAGERADTVWHLESDAPATPFVLTLACDDTSQP